MVTSSIASLTSSKAWVRISFSKGKRPVRFISIIFGMSSSEDRIALDHADQRPAEQEVSLVDGQLVGHPLEPAGRAGAGGLEALEGGLDDRRQSDGIDGELSADPAGDLPDPA